MPSYRAARNGLQVAAEEAKLMRMVSVFAQGRRLPWRRERRLALRFVVNHGFQV